MSCPDVGPACEACGAPAVRIAVDWMQREDGWLEGRPEHKHPLCAAHVRPDTITWLDGTKEEEPRR